jgi:hypothetical protein
MLPIYFPKSHRNNSVMNRLCVLGPLSIKPFFRVMRRIPVLITAKFAVIKTGIHF